MNVTYNDYNERLQSRKRKTISLLRSFFVILSFVLLVSVVYLVINKYSEKKFVLLNLKTKRSICPDGNCDEGLNQIQNAIVCPPLPEHHPICTTKDCTLTAASLLSAMDTSVDPCDDFYAFSCSNFIRKNLFPHEKNEISILRQYNDRHNLQLKNLIENYNSYGEPDIVYKLQEAYHVCVNRSYNREKELADFKDYVINVLDGWPMAVGEEWKPKRERLDDYFANLLSAKIEETIIAIDMKEEFDETSNTTRKFPVVRLSRSYPHLWILHKFNIMNITAKVRDNRNNMTKFAMGFEKLDRLKKNLLFKLMELFGNSTVSFVEDEIEEIFKFVEELNKILPYTILFSKDTQWMTIQELNDFTNGTMDWFKLIKARLHSEMILKISEKVQVEFTQALKQIFELMNKFPRRILTNYITLRTITQHILTIGIPDFDELVNEIRITMGRKIKKESRWKICLHWVIKIYPLVLTRMYVKTFGATYSKETVDYMIQLIQETYKKQINESDWLDEKTKERALRKVDAIKSFVGYPGFILNDTAIEEEYNHMPAVKSSYFENEVELKPLVRKRRKDIMSLTEKDRWFWSTLEMEAFYLRYGNSLCLPLGILQLPYYGENRLAAINFGTIGYVIGHEIGHAFSILGRQFNEKGERENWWSNGTDYLYKERTQCLVNQNSYCPKGIDQIYPQFGAKACVMIIGSSSVAESMPDNTGLIAAYNAYKVWIEENGEEKRLPGLEEYSPEQLFFISFAHISCDYIPNDEYINEYSFNRHVPGRYRVLETLSSNEDFRKAFNCPVGNMNRGNQSCVFW